MGLIDNIRRFKLVARLAVFATVEHNTSFIIALNLLESYFHDRVQGVRTGNVVSLYTAGCCKNESLVLQVHTNN